MATGIGATNSNGLTPQAQALSAENVQRFLVAPLAATSVFLSSGVNILDSANQVRLPTAPDPATNLGYTAEGGIIPEVSPQFGKVTLLPTTMESIKAIAPFSQELQRQSVVAIANALQTYLVDSVAGTVDSLMIAGDGDGVTTMQGLLNFPNTQSLAVGGGLTIDKLYDAITLTRKAFVNSADLRLWVTSDVENQLRKLKDNNGQYLLHDATEAGSATVAGVPLTVTDRIPTAGTTTKSTQAVLWAPRYTWVARDAAPTVQFLKEAYARTGEFGISIASRYDLACAKPQSIVKLTGISV